MSKNPNNNLAPTVPFKRDAVSILAVAIFFIIIILQITIAIAIPWQMRQENIWADRVIRQTARGNFDALRKKVNEYDRPENKNALGELQLIADAVNNQAIFLHENVDRISSEDYASLRDDVSAFTTIRNRIMQNKGTPQCPEYTLDITAFAEDAIKQLEPAAK